MRWGRRRWWAVGVVVVGAVGTLAAGLDDGDHMPEAVHVAVSAQAVLCAEIVAVPAEASSDGLQRGSSPEVVQDARCDELASELRPGEVLLPHHSEAAPGDVVMAGELRFHAQQRCFYVLAGDDAIGVVWPARFVGSVDPPRITVEPGGSSVVAHGDRFAVRGRYVPEVGHECGPVAAQSSGFIASGDVELADGP